MDTVETIKRIVNATSWEESPYGGSCYASFPYRGGTVVEGVFGLSAERLNQLDLNHLQNIMDRLEQLDDEARELLQEQYPDEDVSELSLNIVDFCPEGVPMDGTFQLGYDTGDTDAGQLCLYVRFSPDFTRSSKIIYELY